MTLLLSTGDSILIASRPYATFTGGGIGLTASNTAIWNVNPVLRANHLGMLTTGGLTFDGSGSFADAGKSLVIFSASYADGRTTSMDLKVGEHVRNWRAGSFTCNGMQPFYTTQPTDPLVQELFAGTGTDGMTTVFYDLQHVLLPDTLRTAHLTSLSLQGNFIIHEPCSDEATSEVNGLTVWPSYDIHNRHGGGLGLQKQIDPAWRDSLYGGYVLRDTLFGGFKKINAEGCLLSCMAMVASYFGDSVRVNELNAYLVRHKGYQRDHIVRITAPLSGQDPGASINYVDIGKSGAPPRTNVGDTLLFEARNAAGWSAPLVTAVVGPSRGHATIIQRHQLGVLSVGEEAYAYTDIIQDQVSDGWSQGHWERTELGTSPTGTPARAESTLVDSLPVLLDVCGSPKHYILARGWTPTVGTGSAHGTYTINDPGHTGVTRLIDPHFNNTFARARRYQRTDPGGSYRAKTLSSGMVVVISGGAHASIGGPDGTTFYYDASTDSYIGNMTGAEGWPSYNSILDDDPDAGSPSNDYIDLPDAPDGDYQVNVFTPGAGEYGITTRANSPDVSPQAVGGFTAGGALGYAFRVHLENGPTPVIRVDTLGTAAVQDAPTGPQQLSVRPNPSRGIVEIEFVLPADNKATIDIFDLAGRRVRRLWDGQARSGSNTVRWDRRDATGIAVRPGLYFVHMNIANGSIMRPVAITD